MVYTGELSKTENKGVQIFDVTDSTFTLRWFNDMSAFNEYLFPYQTNSDELYVQVRDSSDAIQRALNLLQMKLGAKTHLLQGAWKLRGTQPDNNAASQYWIERSPRDIYQIFGSQENVSVYANARFPKGSMECVFTPCTYLSDNAFELYNQTCIVHWFNRDAISITSIDDTGHPIVTVWDRCGLPQNIQKTFGTDTPVMTKDISRFYADGFKEKYGVQPDSICKAFETFLAVYRPHIDFQAKLLCLLGPIRMFVEGSLVVVNACPSLFLNLGGCQVAVEVGNVCIGFQLVKLRAGIPAEGDVVGTSLEAQHPDQLDGKLRHQRVALCIAMGLHLQYQPAIGPADSFGKILLKGRYELAVPQPFVHEHSIGRVLYAYAVHRSIVEDNRHAVRRHPHIELTAPATYGSCRAERCNGVLCTSFRTPVAAMCHHMGLGYTSKGTKGE